MIKIARYRNSKDNKPERIETTWEQLSRDLAIPRKTSCDPCPGHACKKKDGTAWSPVDIEGARSSANVKAVTMLVLDLDTITDPEMAAAIESLADFQYLIHTTHAGHGHYRLVMSLTRPVLAREWPRFWERAVDYLGLAALVDTKARDIARLFYFPSTPNPTEFYAAENDGGPIDVDDVLMYEPPKALPPPFPMPQDLVALDVEEAPPPAPGSPPDQGAAGDFSVYREALRKVRKTESREIVQRLLGWAPLAPLGERDDTLNKACGILASVGDRPMPVEFALGFLDRSLAGMPLEPDEDLEYWTKKAVSCYERAAARRVERDHKAGQERAVLLNLLGRAPDIVVEGSSDEWRQGLQYGIDANGNPTGLKPIESNLELILVHDPAFATLRWNEVLRTIEIEGPFKGVNPNDLEFAVCTWLQRSAYKLGMRHFQIGPALLRVSRGRSYDPLRDYLLGLKWDGEPRAHRLFGTIIPTDGDLEYLKVLSRKWLLSAVARALEPGCKVDTCLMLQGDYGTGKTQFIEAMAGPFYSNSRIDFSSSNSRAACSRYWIIEMAEMAGYKRADDEAVKDWLSTRVDSFRPPYGRVLEDFPRRSIFVATVNPENFIREPNRREWLVRVTGMVDLVCLRDVRDQLWAEAVALYMEADTCPACNEAPLGRCDAHAWWLNSEHADHARAQAEEAATVDPLELSIQDWWFKLPPDRRPVQVQVMDIAQEACGIQKGQVSHGQLTRVGRILKRMGFEKRRMRIGGSLAWVYESTEELRAVPHKVYGRPSNLSVIEGQGS